MSKKPMFFSCLFLFCALSIGCGNAVLKTEPLMKNAELNSEDRSRPDIAEADQGAENETNEQFDKNGKLPITYHSYASYYSGYLDHVALFGTMYDNCDFDGDGLTDRIFRNVFDADQHGDVCNYRVDFGNGETLRIGNFSDLFTGFQLTGFDLTGDGVNEMIFCGPHTASTFPKSMSEIAVFQKTDGDYELLSLPRPDDWDSLNTSEKYRVGYSIQLKGIIGNEVTISQPGLDYVETVVVQEKTALEYFRQAGAMGTVGSDAWYIEASDMNGTPAVLLTINIGSRYYERDLEVLLIWRDGALLPSGIRLKEETTIPEQAEADIIAE